MTQADLTICVIIPAYNAEQTLARVVARIPQNTWNKICRVFVIDDGSTDATASCTAALAQKNPKIMLYQFANNRGYGSAVKKGIELSRLFNPAFCVCLHADGQYPPEKIDEFIDFMLTNNIDLLQGSRHKAGTALTGNMPFYKYVFGKLLVFMENKVFGINMTDYHSGFLVYSLKALAKIPVELLSSSFDFDLEMIASARARNLNIEELAIPTHYGDEKSYLNPITYGLRVLRILFRYARGFYEPNKSN